MARSLFPLRCGHTWADSSVSIRASRSFDIGAGSPAHEFLAVASCGLLPGPAHEFLCSRKLRLATTEKLVSWVELVNWAGKQAAACDYIRTRALGCARYWPETRALGLPRLILLLM